MMGYYAIYALTAAANGDEVSDVPTAGYWYDATNTFYLLPQITQQYLPAPDENKLVEITQLLFCFEINIFTEQAQMV